MNDNHTNENYGQIAETLNLSEENTVSKAEGLINNLKSFFKGIRTGFSQKSERSVLSALLESLYIKFLSGKTKATAVFLLSFSIVSLVISYVLNASVGAFISDIDTFCAIVLFIISLILFTTNKSFHSLISNSKILSSLSISYNEQSIRISANASHSTETVYSTPFFLGIICGIFTVIYPVSVICSFIVSLICVLFIINRPECGMLFIISVLPIINNALLLTFACTTFLSLLYRYLLGKRHINFGISALLMLISMAYIIIRCASSSGNVFTGRLYLYLAFYVSCFSYINLIRSTAMFRRTFNVLIRMTRAFTFILVVFYICNMLLPDTIVDAFLTNLGFDSLIHSLSTASFVAPFLAMAVPLNFAMLVCGEKGIGTIKNVFYLILLLASMLYVSSYPLILISILACVSILAFYNKRFIFLIFPAPLVAFGIYKLFSLVPEAYRLSATAEKAMKIDLVIKAIKAKPIFGAGPEAAYSGGNMLLSILLTFGFMGLILLAAVLIFMTSRSVRFIISDVMKANTARFLSIGLLCAQLSFMSVCIFTDIYCDINSVFMFAAIISASVTSGKCYEADYIDQSMVREYRRK
ncbi:MAG: hypothetical protein IJW06_00595 [Clostridia bacterium]|nr:hypothetical protein [Clostridia bacterium]